MSGGAINFDLNPREVAELAGVSRHTVEKAIEEKVLTVHQGSKETSLRSGRQNARRVLGMESVVYSALMQQISANISLKFAAKRNLISKLKLYQFLGLRLGKIEIAPSIEADVGAIAGGAFDRAQKYIVSRNEWITSDAEIMGGMPIIRGTRIPAHSVEGRVRAGDSLEEIIAENHDVPRQAFEAAFLYAKTHPLAGRPVRSAARAK